MMRVLIWSVNAFLTLLGAVLLFAEDGSAGSRLGGAVLMVGGLALMVFEAVRATRPPSG